MTARTSLTHPLQIQSVVAPGCAGRIGMTLCPGKKQRNALTGDWDRDLDEDLSTIVAWGSRVLVSLMEKHEFERFGVAALPELATVHGLEWIHLPIPDGSIPTQIFETAWAIQGQLLKERVLAGEHIVLHCRGGLGRTGMMAARLLVELGVGPTAAIQQVRAARPGTIETPAQERYVHLCQSRIFEAR